jgi:hypothetical protein
VVVNTVAKENLRDAIAKKKARIAEIERTLNGRLPTERTKLAKSLGVEVQNLPS